MRLTADALQATQRFAVVKDPQLPSSDADIAASTRMQVRIRDDMNETAEMINRIEVMRRQIEEQVKAAEGKEDVLKSLHQGKHDAPLAEVVREAHYVPESKKVADLLREMQREKFHQALVTDEYGSVTGIVALEDLLEELVGEITDEYDVEEPEMVEVGDGVYRVSGKTSIDDLNDTLGTALPDEEWDTVGGLVLDIFGKIPDAGEEADFQGLRFRAEEVQGRRVATVVITRVPVEVLEDDVTDDG